MHLTHCTGIVFSFPDPWQAALLPDLAAVPSLAAPLSKFHPHKPLDLSKARALLSGDSDSEGFPALPPWSESDDASAHSEDETAAQKANKSKSSRGRSCACCHTASTPLWRDAGHGRVLCNACGIRFKKYGLLCATCSVR